MRWIPRAVRADLQALYSRYIKSVMLGWSISAITVQNSIMTVPFSFRFQEVIKVNLNVSG